MCNYRYAGFSACHDFFIFFVCHSPSQSWTSSIGLVSLESWSWTSKSWSWSWSWNCWVLVLVLDKQVLNPSLIRSTGQQIGLAVFHHILCLKFIGSVCSLCKYERYYNFYFVQLRCNWVPIIYAQYLYWYWYLKVMYWYWYLKVSTGTCTGTWTTGTGTGTGTCLLSTWYKTGNYIQISQREALCHAEKAI